MIRINSQPKKSVAIYVCNTHQKGVYPFRRAAAIAKALPKSIEITFITSKKEQPFLNGYSTIYAEHHRDLLKVLQKLKPSLLLRDSGSTSKEEVANIKKIVPSIIHFDDFGSGGDLASFVIQTLYTETYEKQSDHYIVGYETFIADEQITPYKKIGLNKKEPASLPHLVVTFGEEDPNNLTYRALRHLLHLQIPLKITILVGEQYKHDLIDLRMMALSRKNTTIQHASKNAMEILSNADIVLCAASYTPYEVGAMGIPCIVLAQNDFESTLDFPNERNGFIHLGLGRKIKQSNLLNAVMELLLHDSLRKKMIQRQTDLNLGSGKDMICEAVLYCLDYPKRKGASKETFDMI